ncbi:MAG: hypothetical protein RBS80_27945 [Thermoguttaceae bacterium]|jgi:Mg/Co/Ni transporter MgtE|nr:hypothetical protein [Thermoguttaceae bacterium]
MKNPLLVPEIRELLAEGNFDELRDFCEAGHPGIVAEFLSALTTAVDITGLLIYFTTARVLLGV